MMVLRVNFWYGFAGIRYQPQIWTSKDMDLVTAPPDHIGIGCPRQRAALAAFSSYALGDPDLDELLEEIGRAHV